MALTKDNLMMHDLLMKEQRGKLDLAVPGGYAVPSLAELKKVRVRISWRTLVDRFFWATYNNYSLRVIARTR